MIRSFSNKTKEALGYYVYVYSDPDTKKPFYVGKGIGNRVFDHLDQQSECAKVQKITEIKARGKEPLIEILVHGLDEKTALKVEAAAIDLIGIENLTNKQRGHDSSTYGKIEASILEARYVCEKVTQEDIEREHSVMLIRINELYRNDMTPLELYEATRGYWVVNPNQASKVEYVFSVYDGMIIEVYQPMQWFPKLSTYTTRQVTISNNEKSKPRYEFVGKIADTEIRALYVGKSVADIFTAGAQNPIKYIWKKE